MTASPILTRDDPLDIYPTGAFVRNTEAPLPLTATSFTVSVRGGVARVATRRTFRNADHRSIEATLTMPMPVRAVLYSLAIETGGRVLHAHCLPIGEAVATYESQGVNRGRLAVLHEEVLCGVHKLSIANIAPGAEVTVESVWTTSLTPTADGRAGFRIPLTVGDIYGRSPLSDVDDLVSGGAASYGRLTVEGDDVTVLSGGKPLDGSAEVALDRPLDVSVPLRPWSSLHAKAADGRRIALSLKPERIRDAGIDAAVLVDRSGSMADRSGSQHDDVSKFAAVRAGIAQAAAGLGGADRLHFFAFSSSCEELGPASSAAECSAALTRLGEPGGGTEIGGALGNVLARSAARDIVLITDGKSHALDVAALLRSGRRFTVVLIGEDSLEARVGELAANSGGALMVARTRAVAEAVTSAFATLRSPHALRPTLGLPLREVTTLLDGLRIEAKWTEGEAPCDAFSEAVRALATSLALPCLTNDDAAKLAVAEGLVGRATSLVLVDELSQVQEGLPVTYKLATPTPSTAISAPLPAAPRSRAREHAYEEAPVAPPRAVSAPPPTPAAAPPRHAAAKAGGWRLPSFLRRQEWRRVPERFVSPTPDLAGEPGPKFEESIWNFHGTDLINGNVDRLPSNMAAEIRDLAARPGMSRCAQRLNRPPLLTAIGILARRAGNRWAARVAERIFQGIASDSVDAAIAELFAAPTRTVELVRRG